MHDLGQAHNILTSYCEINDTQENKKTSLETSTKIQNKNKTKTKQNTP